MTSLTRPVERRHAPARRKTGGRRPLVDVDGIRAAGLRVGLVGLSISSVATELGVSPAAIYRHVAGGPALERLVGEAVLDQLVLREDPAHGTVEHLVSFARQLRTFTLAHPGSAWYFQQSFPRGASGVRLLEAEVVALSARGYDDAAAVVLSSAVARVTLGQVVRDEARSVAEPEQQDEVGEALSATPRLVEAVLAIPSMDDETAFDLLIGATVRGLVETVPQGVPLREVLGAEGHLE